MIELAVIVAASENGVIGQNNALPWQLPEDLRYFKRVTTGKPIVMGRKTFESIGRPLPGRTNIVISRNPDYQPAGVEVAASLDLALALAERVAAADGACELMVIGGAQIYAAAIPMAQRLYLTRVHTEIEGDAFLPAIDWAHWRKISCERHAALGAAQYDYSFIIYERSS